MQNHINTKSLKRKFSRRELLKDTAIAAGVGTIVGTSTYLGLNFLGKNLKGILTKAEEEIKELTLDVSELSGSLESKLIKEREQLEEHYTNGILKIYEELEIATPAEVQEIEHIIKTYEEFEEHYNFVERARTFKDRIDSRLLALDETLESYEPKAVRKINDSIRSVLGKPTGEQGIKYRLQIRGRLERLCAVYDTNSDNKIAQAKILETLNEYLNDANIPSEEKELYNFLKEQYNKGSNEENLRYFIENYKSYGDRQDVLFKALARNPTLLRVG